LAASAHLGTTLALTIELKDVAPDRVERQRHAAEGRLPLPGTPHLASLEHRLSVKGLHAGEPVFIRLFKAESELELWMRKGNRFVLFDIYPICHWSGTIGPKMREGDKQNPEGFYSARLRKLHLRGRWPRSLNLGFPNPYDKALARTGSYILIHGGCSSVGCFAMTDGVMEEIYTLVEKALKANQERIWVHAFPFRMTDANLARFQSSEWHEFWRNLKEGYDAFEATRLPPQISVCDNRYVVQQVSPEESAEHQLVSMSVEGTRHTGRPRGRGEYLESACRPGGPPVVSAKARRNVGRNTTKHHRPPHDADRDVQAVSDHLREVIFAPR
jgi:murein L,D-transpeptidase YafK